MTLTEITNPDRFSEQEWHSQHDAAKAKFWNKLTQGWFIVSKDGKQLKGPFKSQAAAESTLVNRTDLPAGAAVKYFD